MHFVDDKKKRKELLIVKDRGYYCFSLSDNGKKLCGSIK